MIGKIIELNDCHQPKQIKNFKNGAFIQDKRECIEKNNTSASKKISYITHQRDRKRNSEILKNSSVVFSI